MHIYRSLLLSLLLALVTSACGDSPVSISSRRHAGRVPFTHGGQPCSVDGLPSRPVIFDPETQQTLVFTFTGNQLHIERRKMSPLTRTLDIGSRRAITDVTAFCNPDSGHVELLATSIDLYLNKALHHLRSDDCWETINVKTAPFAVDQPIVAFNPATHGLELWGRNASSALLRARFAPASDSWSIVAQSTFNETITSRAYPTHGLFGAQPITVVFARNADSRLQVYQITGTQDAIGATESKNVALDSAPVVAATDLARLYFVRSGRLYRLTPSTPSFVTEQLSSDEVLGSPSPVRMHDGTVAAYVARKDYRVMRCSDDFNGAAACDVARPELAEESPVAVLDESTGTSEAYAAALADHVAVFFDTTSSSAFSGPHQVSRENLAVAFTHLVAGPISTALAGGNGGNAPVTTDCPATHVAVGVNLWYGNEIRAIQLICRPRIAGIPFDPNSQSGEVLLDAQGTTAGQVGAPFICPSTTRAQGVLVGLRGVANAASGNKVMRSLQLVCGKLAAGGLMAGSKLACVGGNPNGLPGTCDINGNTGMPQDYDYWFDLVGISNETYFAHQTPNALVSGLRTRTGDVVDAIGLRTRSVASGADLSFDGAKLINAEGGSGGNNFDSACPNETVLGGVEVYHGADIDGVRALCVPRDVDAANVTTDLGVVGTPGGSSSEVFMCPDGPAGTRGVVIGIQAAAAQGPGTVVMRGLRVQCGVLSNTSLA
ncbi:MAG: hypothetical protein KC503_32215, partial [Myxococcales bacterium]|nr:hypothetical protein [Myxococcales bacterium]